MLRTMHTVQMAREKSWVYTLSHLNITAAHQKTKYAGLLAFSDEFEPHLISVDVDSRSSRAWRLNILSIGPFLQNVHGMIQVERFGDE